MAGKYFEQLEPGLKFVHQPPHTVEQADNERFCQMTRNPQPLHLDAEFAAQSPYGQIIINSLYTLGLLIGASVEDTTLGTTLGNLGMESTEFPNPVFIGDTLSFSTEVVDRKESKSKPDRGVVWFRHLAVNQRDEVVCDCLRKAMMLKQSI
ncbi:MAG: MaoC family dehydratase [Gammaproteobacteria bacterium]